MAQSKNIDQINREKVIKELGDLGLSEKEAKVYLALLPRRGTGSSKLVQATGLHKQFVYTALYRLEGMGLAKHVIENGRKKFSPVTPKRLLSIAEEKRLAAQATAQKLQMWFSGAHEQDFEVLQGAGAFISHQLSLIEKAPEGSVINVISGPNDKYFSTFGEEGMADEYERLRIKKKIRVRYLGGTSVREKLAEMEKWREYWTYRAFRGLSTGMVDMGIWPDCIVLNVFGDPLLSFVITGKEVSDGYREFVEGIWKLSSK